MATKKRYSLHIEESRDYHAKKWAYRIESKQVSDEVNIKF